VKAARIDIYAFISSRWFMVREADNNTKFYKQERLYCRTAVRKRIIFLHYGEEVNIKKN
jgi:hypothetical protein